MDLNPQTPDWTSAEGPYELADYCIAKKTNVLLLLNAWLDSKEETEEEKDWQTLNYWAARMTPLWTDKVSIHSKMSQNNDPGEGQETIVVVCNRVGDENGKSGRPFLDFRALLSLDRVFDRYKICWIICYLQPV